MAIEDKKKQASDVCFAIIQPAQVGLLGVGYHPHLNYKQ